MTGLLSLRSSVLLQKGKIIMFAKSSATIAGILLLGALTGCSGPNDEASKKMSPSPSATETPSPTPTQNDAEPLESVLDYSQPIVLAKDDLEMEFLTIAVNSCKKAQTYGFVAKTIEGESIFRPALEGNWPDWPFDQVSVVDGKSSVPSQIQDLFYLYWPSFLNPCYLEAAARNREPDDVYLEHKLIKIDEGTYSWAQHNGGANLDEVIFEVSGDLISGYEAVEGYPVEITYGPLTDEQISLLDQAKK
jgi:hypothetical protein